MTTDTPVPSTSDEDARYALADERRAAVELTRRTAIEAAASYYHSGRNFTYVLKRFWKEARQPLVDQLAAARAEIAAQAATITKIRADNASLAEAVDRAHDKCIQRSELLAVRAERDEWQQRAETAETQLAEAQLEATKLATEGEWDYEYGMNALVTGHFIAYNSEGEARAWVGVHEQPLMRRRRWRGPVQAAEETTE